MTLKTGSDWPAHNFILSGVVEIVDKERKGMLSDFCTSVLTNSSGPEENYLIFKNMFSLGFSSKKKRNRGKRERENEKEGAIAA